MSTSVDIQRVHRSQVLVGDGNVSVLIQPGGETTLQAGEGLLDSLTLRGLPALRVPPSRGALVGRSSLIAAAAADLDAGRHVQLVGASGVGRAAVARALVVHSAAAQRPGAVLLAGAEPHTLDSLYTRLSGLFFDALWHRPDEPALRAVTGRLGPSGLIVIADCDLAGAEPGRLLETFPQCRFLVTSASASPALEASGSVHEVTALTLADVDLLVAQALGRELSDPEREQAQTAHRLAGGRVAALVTSAAFLRRAAASPQPTELVALPPDRQAELLLAGFDEPTRRVVAALAAFGPAPAWLFPALTENVSGPDSDNLALALAQAGLIQESDDGYAISEDATNAAGNVPATETHAIAERLRSAYEQASASPPAAFSLEVVRALIAVRDWEPASRLARQASAHAVAAGRMEPWSELVSLGAQAAQEARLTDDLGYFLRQRHTDALLRDDLAAAALLLTALMALPHAIPPPTPALLTRVRPARRVLSTGRHLAMAGHGAGAVAATVAVAAVAGAAVGSAQSSRPAAATRPPAATSSAPALAAWMNPATAGAPTWTLTTSATPLTPLTTAAGTVQAQFPVISSGIADPARRTQAETALQQPIRQVVTGVAKLVSSAKSAGIVNSGYGSGSQSVPTETTTITQAGDLVSVVYRFGDPNAAGPGAPGAIAVLMRKDNATLIPQQAVLTAAATTPDGATRLNALVASLLPPSQATAVYPPTATGCAQSSAAGFVGPAIGVTADGLTFYVGTAADSCAGGIAVSVPYSKLNGLVNPLIVSLVGVKGGA
ncbi:hypothetical protein ABH926_005881 [Catenulispora sp. GP43]|uniref:hypothetical protein n=1 Tax=Catenulispora sp. GP43 TaxID=3156263 RepID=UPI003517C398